MTVSDARSLLLKYVGPLDSTSDSEFLSSLNHLRKRFYDSGKWVGLIGEADVYLAENEDSFTLPDDCESVLGAQAEGRPILVFGQMHEFLPGGPGDSINTPVMMLNQTYGRSYRVSGKGGEPLNLKLSCKKRYSPLRYDTDTVLPDNEGALKLGLMSLSYEDNNDLERAEQYFSKALALLNGESKESRGAAQHVLQQSPHGFNLGQLRNMY
jgi:hypothetical protein